MSLTYSGRSPARAADPARPLGQPGRRTERPARRVRHEVRDGVVVIAFSALSSTGLAVAMLLLLRLAG